MATTRTRGIFVERDGSRTINKIFKGARIYIRLGQASQDEAEERLKEEISRLSSAKDLNTRSRFSTCAKRYLDESKDKPSHETLTHLLNAVLPYIQDLDVSQIHDETLEKFKEDRRLQGVSATTINRSLQVVRTILNRAARAWRGENGEPLLKLAPPLLTMEQEDRRPPYPLNWEEQDALMLELPEHLRIMALFGVNTGLRNENICGLKWEWELHMPETGRSVFIIPPYAFKTNVPHVLILNDVAWHIIEKQRSIKWARNVVDLSESFVFNFEGGRIDRMNNSAWEKARTRAAVKLYQAAGGTIPKELMVDGQRGLKITAELKKFMIKKMPGFANLRVHDLRHTYSSRLRLAGVTQEDRNALMGHKSASIPEHYASADIGRLITLANLVLNRQGTRTILRVTHK